MADFIGTAQLDRKTFTKLIGDTAEQVWSCLCGIRQAYGRVHITVPGIARAEGFAPLKVRTVQRALTRLRQAGLVRDLGRRVIYQKGWPIEVYVREVYGAYAGRETVFLPTDVWPKVKRMEPARGHGGQRDGAGRRVESRGANSDSSDLQEPVIKRRNVELPAVADPHHATRLSADESRGAQVNESRGAPIRSQISDARGLVSSLRSETAPAGAGSAFESLEEAHPTEREELMPADPPKAAPTHPPETPEKGPQKPPDWRALAEKGLVPSDPVSLRLGALLSGLTPRAPVSWGQGGLPPYPSTDTFMYTMPCPPKIPAYLEEREEQLEFCLKWYRAAVESRVGKSYVKLAGQTRGYFEDALEVFLAHEIRPGAWTAWALDRILLKLPTNARGRFTPQVKQLLSPKTLTESRWQYREAESSYATQGLVTTDAGWVLHDRMHKLETEVLKMEAPRSEAVVKKMVEAHFPEGWVTATRRTREKATHEGQNLITRLKLGHWLWPLPRQLEGMNGRTAA